MMFKSKSKGYFVDKNEHSWMLARASALSEPCVIEHVVEAPLDDSAALEKAILEVQGGKASGNYLAGVCAVYPPHRVIRRVSLDAKRLKDPSYLNEVCIQQFRIEPEKHALVAMHPAEGQTLDPARLSDKEVVIAGIPNEEVVATQDALLASGVYPNRLELGSVSTMGAIADYLRFAKVKSPTLVLELGNDTTHSFILSPSGIEATRPIPFGIESMVPVVQKKLGLKDEESARKLFYSNTFDFTSMGSELVQRLLKELQSSIGFYEVQTGQSITQLLCTSLPSKLGWIQASIAGALGISALKVDFPAWLQSHQISLSEQAKVVESDLRWLNVVSLMLSHHNAATSNAASADKKD